MYPCHPVEAGNNSGAAVILVAGGGHRTLNVGIYGNGRHPGDPLPDGSRMSGALTDRHGMPLGTWQYRFIEWFRDLGFLQKPGVETKAAKDTAAFLSQPLPKPYK